MSEATLGLANVILRGKLELLDKDLDQARSKVGAAVDKISANVQNVGRAALVGVGIVGSAAAGVAAGLGKLAFDAAPVEGLSMAFEGLATASGSSMDEMLTALQRGSSGMISQRQLMASYNAAAQLVSTTFANQLPEAMGYLAKVSAATGQDMGFMMDSLVKGVGRLSPMILDNLGVQVSLAEATELASQMFGVEADAMDKSQIQAGMMAVTMEKLKANTAAMPDVSESAAAGIARMKASMQDMKDRVGVALLPVLNSVLSTLMSFLPNLEPVFQFFETTIVPILQTVADNFGNFFSAIQDGASPIESLSLLFQGLLPEDTVNWIVGALEDISTWIQGVIDTVKPYVEAAGDWISKNVELKDVLIALGIAIMSVVVPAIWALISPMLPIILTLGALIAAVALVRNAWENNWGGIRDKLQAVWDWIRPVFESVKAWLEENIPKAIETLKKFWEETLLPAIEKVWKFVSEDLFPLFDKIIEFFEVLIAAAIDTMARYWEETLKPALEKVWEFISTYLLPIFGDIIQWFGDIVSKIEGPLKGAFDFLKTKILEPVIGFFGNLSETVQDLIGWFDDLIGRIEGASRLGSGLGSSFAGVIPTAAAGGGSGGAYSQAVSMGNNPAEIREMTVYNLTIHSQAQTEQVAGDFETMRALAGRR